MRLLVLVGPSGTGKSTLIRELHGRGIVDMIPSWTTRPRRADEIGERVDHRFVSNEEFRALEGAGHFLETVAMFGSRYGLPEIQPSSDGRVPSIVVRASLLDLVAKHFPDHVVYQIESGFEEARERIVGRTGTGLQTQARLDSYREEIALGRERCSRRFETSDAPTEVVGAVARAIAEDFQVERSRS